MPRIYTKLNDPVDFCVDCFPSYEEAVEEFGEGVAYDAEHPPYQELFYVCNVRYGCGRPLTELDN